VVFAQVDAGVSRPCTRAENLRAENEASKPRGWDALYRVYRQYGRCDDVDAEEGFSESVARILVDHWESLPRLAQLGTADVGFRRFVLGHVDATLDTKDLKRILTMATYSCPHRQNLLCGDLRIKADAAINEDAEAHARK